MGIFTGEAPDRVIVPLDSGTTGLMGDQYKQAVQSDKAIADSLNNGVKQAGQTPFQQPQKQLGEDSAMLQAIRNKYMGIAGKHVNDITKQNALQTPMIRSQYLKSATGSALAQQNIEGQNLARLLEANFQSEMIRAQVLSGIFGAVGMGAGMYFGSQGQEPSTKSPISKPAIGDSYRASTNTNYYGGPNTFGGSDYSKQLGGE